MLQKLRNLNEQSKRKLIVFLAGSITLVVFVLWAIHFTGVFGLTIVNIKESARAIYGSVDEKIGDIYNDFEKRKSEFLAQTTLDVASSTATTSSEASTTIESVLK